MHPAARASRLQLRSPWVPFLLTLPLAACSTGTASEPAPVQAPIEGFDAERAWSDLEALVDFGPRPAGSAELEECRRYIEKRLRELGLEPRRETFTQESTPVGPVTFHNLLADLPGTPRATEEGEQPAPIVYLASHYDTKLLPEGRFVGANDGGSSTAALLELARVLKSSGPRPVTYRLAFFDGEEPFRERWLDPDNTYGSRYHARQLQLSEEFDQVRAMVLLDMVGDRHLRLWRDTYSSRELLRIFMDAARQEGLGLYFTGASLPVRDDHLPFLEIGIPAVDLIDLDYGPESRNNDWWHTPEDTLENCSQQSLAVVGRILLAGLPVLEQRVLGSKRR